MLTNNIVPFNIDLWGEVAKVVTSFDKVFLHNIIFCVLKE